MEGVHTGQICKGPVATSHDYSYPTLPREGPERAGIKVLLLLLLLRSFSELVSADKATGLASSLMPEWRPNPPNPYLLCDQGKLLDLSELLSSLVRYLIEIAPWFRCFSC